jgi:hypothetical protein
MKTCGGVDVSIHVFLTLAIVVGELWSTLSEGSSEMLSTSVLVKYLELF